MVCYHLLNAIGSILPRARTWKTSRFLNEFVPFVSCVSEREPSDDRSISYARSLSKSPTYSLNEFLVHLLIIVLMNLYGNFSLLATPFCTLNFNIARHIVNIVMRSPEKVYIHHCRYSVNQSLVRYDVRKFRRRITLDGELNCFACR